MKTTRIKPKSERILGEAPPGWVTGAIAGETGDFVSGVDHVTVHSGHASAYIRSTVEEPEGFGALTQKCRSQRFLETRLRLSGYLRADHIAEWGALWMRVDDVDDNVLAFDNMEDRPVRGTTEWLKRSVVLDIPTSAASISFGALLVGAGILFVDDLALEKVGQDVPATSKEDHIFDEAMNLDFEKS